MNDALRDPRSRSVKALLLPRLREMNARLKAQGKCNDPPDTPKNLTWNEWLEKKRDALGMAPRTAKLLRATGDTKRPAPKPRATAARSEPNPGTTQLLDWIGDVIRKVEKHSAECPPQVVFVPRNVKNLIPVWRGIQPVQYARLAQPLPVSMWPPTRS